MVVDSQHQTELSSLVNDLIAEGNDLEGLVAELSGQQWRQATPAEGWTIAHQIAHLAWTDDQALASLTDHDTFNERLAEAINDPDGFVDKGAEAGAQQPPAELLSSWRAGRKAVAEALEAAPPGTRAPWFGPSMSVASMATARLMETWAHGQDIADALSIARTPTRRLRHVAWIGVRTRDFAFAANELPAPAEPFRVELTAPDRSTWSWGPEDAAQRVSGSAWDFCLLVTQRRHQDDTDVKAVGGDAQRWLEIAQAFAGPPGTGREPGQF